MSRKAECLSILTALLFSGSPVSAQRLVDTNEQIVIASVRMAVRDSLKNEDYGRILITLADNGIDRPVSGGIAGALRDLGFEVLADGHGDEPADNLDYDILGFDFSYGGGSSRGFLRKPMIRREFKAQLRITVKAPPGGTIVHIEDIAVEYSDQIAPRFAELARSRDIPELAPDLPGSGWTKIVEPLIVTAGVGSLVYLFFANR